MKETIRKFVANGQDTGLMLLDMPTGSGKTYSVLEYITEESLKLENRNQKYIFITTLKKNLPCDLIASMFRSRGKEKEFYEKFLFIDSNADCVIENFSLAEKFVPKEIVELPEYQNLKKNIEIIKKNEGGNQSAISDFLEILNGVREEIRTKLEPEFRHAIEKRLQKDFYLLSERLKAVRKSKEWGWVSILYPAALTKDRQIFFLSMDKFLLRNSTIIEPSYLFTSSSLIKDSIIFIDEFDATKDTMLTNMIRTGLEDTVDYLTLFRKIYYVLQNKTFPQILTTQSKAGQKRSNLKTPKEIIENFQQRIDHIYDNFKLCYSMKTVTEMDESRNFLFHDHRYHTVLQNGKKFIKMELDEKKQIYNITFVDNKPKDEFQNIQILLGRIEREIKWFERGVFFLAQNYMELKNEEAGTHSYEEFSLESAVKSVLSLFGLEDEYMEFLCNHIMSDEKSHRESQFSNEALRDKSFFQTGFRYFDFVNDVNDDMQSTIHMTSMTSTPEKLLLQIIDNAKVIGISATATLKTVLGNYDLEYIRQNITDRYYVIPDEDRKRMNWKFRNSQRGYDKVNINTKLFTYDQEDGWVKIFHNKPELAERAAKLIEDHLGLYQNIGYAKLRYMRITSAYKHFILNKMKSFLCVMTMHPTDYHSTMEKAVLSELFSMIHTEIGWCGEFNPDSVCYLNGTEYDENKQYVSRRLSEGNKLFVISVYQTLGAGQNLQYEIPLRDRNRMVCINNERHSIEKDYDGIYLDKPTNMIVSNKKFPSEESFIRYIYQMEYLNESGELSSAESTALIKAAFATHLMPKEDKSIPRQIRGVSPYNTLSCENLGARTIIQAVGRICRTNMKNSDIYLFAHDEILRLMDSLDINEREYNVEFKSLYNTFSRLGFNQRNTMSYYEQQASKRSEIASRSIHDFLHEREWTPERIELWDALRDYVLKHPTLSDEEFLYSKWKNGYFHIPEKLNHYWFGVRKEEYKEIPVHFKKPAEGSFNEVSSSNCLLDFLMKQDFLRNEFIKNGYATSFNADNAIMTPTLYREIYKGALGEIVGCMLLTWKNQFQLDRVPLDAQRFEYFDYQVRGTNVYVDFKNWKPSMIRDEESELEKIGRKAGVCGAEAVLIINIYEEAERDCDVRYEDGTRVMQVPSLLIKGEDGIPHTNVKVWTRIIDFINGYRKD